MRSLFIILIFIFPVFLKADDSIVLKPTDDSQNNPSFLAFKKKLLVALKEKDVDYIKSIIKEKEVSYTFGYDEYWEETKDSFGGFLKHYKLDRNHEKSELWKQLELLVTLGCVDGRKNNEGNHTFICPYYYIKWPDKVDSYDYILLIEKDVPVKEKPTSTSKTLKLESYKVFKLATKNPGKKWVEIKLDKKNTGYVDINKTNLVSSLRVGFEQIKGKWKISFFIDGD